MTIIETLFNKLELVEDYNGLEVRNAGIVDYLDLSMDVEIHKTEVGLEIVCLNHDSCEGDRAMIYGNNREEFLGNVQHIVSIALGCPVKIKWADALRQEDDQFVFIFDEGAA